MGASALALTLLHVRHLHALGPHPRPAWWLLAGAFAVAELCVVHVEFRRNVHIFSLSELPLVFGLIFAEPWAMLLGILLGPIVVLVVNRGQSPVKVAFNVTLFWLGGALAATIFHALLAADAVIEPSVWGAALLATLANAVLGALLVCAVIRLSGQPIAFAKLMRTLAMATAVCITNTCLALGGAAAVAADARAAVLLVIPAAAVVLAYRAYMAERRKHESLEFLHEVTRLLARAPDITAGISGLLQRTLDVFRGDLAEIILLPSDQRSEALRTTVEQGGTVEPMVLADRYVADALHALVDGDTPARLLERPLADPLLDAALARRGVQRAMLAALPGETRVVGTFLVANRSTVGSFDGHDLTLFGTLANHASVSLEYDRLEHLVSQLRELQGRLEHQAFHDPLTGPGQPRALPRPPRRAARLGPARLHRPLPRPRRLQDDQRLARALDRRRAAGGGRRPPARRAEGAATSPRGSAATSSPCSCTTSATPSTSAASPTASSGCSSARSRSPGTRSRRTRASGSSRAGRRRSTAPRSCCATPTSPCTRPRTPASSATRSSSRRCTPPSCAATA